MVVVRTKYFSLSSLKSSLEDNIFTNLFYLYFLFFWSTKNRKTIFSIENPSDFGSLFDSFIKQNSLAYTFSVRIPLLGQIDVSIDSLLPDGAHKTHPISSCPSKIAETREHFRNLEMFDIYSDGRVRLCKIYRRWKSPSPYNFIHVFPDSDT